MISSQGLAPRPLRPMTFSDILEGALRLYQANFVSLVTIVVGIQVVVAIVAALAAAVTISSRSVYISLVFGAFAAAVAIVGIFLQAGALTIALADDYLGQPISAQRSLEAARDRLGPLVGTTLLVGLILVVLSITLILIPVAIFLGVRWIFVAQTTMLERLSGTGAWNRSTDLVRGSWWRIFGVAFVAAFIVFLISRLFGAVFSSLFHRGPLTALLEFIVQVLVTPFPTAVITLLYFDQRVRKEGLNQQTLSDSMSSMR